MTGRQKPAPNSGRGGRYVLRVAGLGYLALLLLAPLSLVFWRTFEHGLGPAWGAVSNPAARHAILITLVILPLALSPVVVGLAFLLLYGQSGWFGSWLTEHGIQVVFALPGMVLVTIFVSLPFVVREVVPVLREIGTEQEQAASTLGASSWQTFRRITLPAIRWAVTYGVVLSTARALGEFGAVSVISGRIVGKTETMTLHVQERYQAFDYVGAYASAVVLALLALTTLVVLNVVRREEPRGDRAEPGHEAVR